ncbi:hypothetical protein PUN28_017605 [Cardiocondyla obscurior]|uniref:Secreted protein n=1 Tax=Cardiocondyla obscurior TaxID=286306 RepID=A0AAW2EKG7_9HYME
MPDRSLAWKAPFFLFFFSLSLSPPVASHVTRYANSCASRCIIIVRLSRFSNRPDRSRRELYFPLSNPRLSSPLPDVIRLIMQIICFSFPRKSLNLIYFAGLKLNRFPSPQIKHSFLHIYLYLILFLLDNTYLQQHYLFIFII